jgi:hypothetical protein
VVAVTRDVNRLESGDGVARGAARGGRLDVRVAAPRERKVAWVTTTRSGSTRRLGSLARLEQRVAGVGEPASKKGWPFGVDGERPDPCPSSRSVRVTL